jgi:hypothetical protein
MQNKERALMKRFVLSLIALSLIAGSASAEERLPFNVRTYGSFKKIIASKTPDGVVDLKDALAGIHVYAVGELEEAEGEITDYDGQVWLNYGSDGIDTSTHKIPDGAQAMELITARVAKWRDIIIPKTMPDSELSAYVIDQARKYGINVKLPFPFLVDGTVKDVVWHVLSGADVEQGGKHTRLSFTKLVEYKDEAPAILVAFCSEFRGGFIRPGEPWHMHIIFKNEKTAGHIDAFTVEKGAKLMLPVN